MKIILSLFVCLFAFAKSPNHLLGQTSPYLKQHLYNKVRWYPWSKKAFLKAKKEHKPIFLSIGYSTCHWCEVMNKESFENPHIATLINRYFIPILVDKEQMPQVDSYYQNLYKKIYKKRGGWPLNIIMSEDKEPFFIAKYIPSIDSYGVLGLNHILPMFAKAYKNKKLIRKKILFFKDSLEKNDSKYRNHNKTNTIELLYKEFDKEYGGFGKKKKYPQSAKLNLIYDIYLLKGDKKAKEMFLKTLRSMAKGSIYDQIEGGFFRYTGDRRWRSPHFEKMLYTTAELIPLYVKAYDLTKDSLFERVVIDSIDFFDRHFKTKDGLYFSASSADSEGMEGGYYLYKYDKTLKYLIQNGISKKRAKEILNYFDIQKDGNYDSEYALATVEKDKKLKNLKKAIELLKQIRRDKNFPFIDKKIITSWNSMMIKAKLKASYLKKRYKNEAIESLISLIKLMQNNKGELYHQTFYGKKPVQKGFLEDYAYLADTLLVAYEETFDKTYLLNANKLANIAIKKFYKDKIWYLDKDEMVKADSDDFYYTSAKSVMIRDLLYLSLLNDSLIFRNIAKKSLRNSDKNPILSPEIANDNLMLKSGILVLKSSKTNLLKFSNTISNLPYPFLLLKTIKDKNFLLCGYDSCFIYGDFQKIVNFFKRR